MRRNRSILIWLVLLTLSWGSVQASSLYVLNEGDASVSVVDTATNSLIATIILPASPMGDFSVDDVGNVYLQAGSDVVMITGTSIAATIPINGINMSVSADGSMIASVEEGDGLADIIVQDVATGVERRLERNFYRTDGEALFFDGLLYIRDYGRAIVYDPLTLRKVVTDLVTGQGVLMVDFVKGAGHIYFATGFRTSNLWEMDLDNLSTRAWSIHGFGFGSRNIALLPNSDDTTVMVTMAEGNTREGLGTRLGKLDLVTGVRQMVLETSQNMGALAYNEDESFLYVAMPDLDEVQVMDMATSIVGETIPVGDHPGKMITVP
jgi:YVTN family beta-propeller protein